LRMILINSAEVLSMRPSFFIPFLFLLGIAAAAQADDMPAFNISIKSHHFSPATFEVPVDTRFRINVKNEDDTPEEFESQDLDFEKIIPPHREGFVYVRPLDAGKYHFFGDFHQDTAQGDLFAK